MSSPLVPRETMHRIPLSELTIKLANPSQNLELLRAIADYPLWGGDLSFETFCEMEDRAEREGAWTKDHGALIWALVRRDDPEGEVYCACETHRTACFVRPANATHLEEGWCYGVTVVISPQRHRGKGYGKHFMRLLHYMLAQPSDLPPFPVSWGAPPPPLSDPMRRAVPYATASLLASEIGPDFYAACTRGLDLPGWVAKADDQDCLIWDLHKPSKESNPTDWKHFAGGWTAIYEEDTPRVASALSTNVRQRLLEIPPENHIRIAPDPASPGILTFAHRWGSFMPLPPWYSAIDPMPIGLQRIAPDGRVATVLIAMWNFQMGKRFNLTLLHDLLPDDLPTLLLALDQLTSTSHYVEGWVWGLPPDSPLVQAWRSAPGRSVKVIKREGSNLMSDVVYTGEGEVVDKQLWTWL